VLPIAELRPIDVGLMGRTAYLITTAWPMASIIVLNSLVVIGQLKWMALIPLEQDYGGERLSWVHVDPEFRRRGLAKRMVEIATVESDARGWAPPEQLWTPNA
jgi:ribosomal protein S18 acetylase RimI-like enzyme